MDRITDMYVREQKYVIPNLDISHRCILRCSQCNRQKSEGGDQIRRGFDLDEKDFMKILDYYVSAIMFCGQISDPIYHPSFLSFLEICNENKRPLKICTNGTGKNLEWWKEAFSYGKNENAWIFGVDGIDSKSEIYRVGSNFNNVWEMMRLGKKLGNIIVWQFIIFGYNEHEIDEAIEIAKREGFSLMFVNSDRNFDNKDKLRKTVSLDSLRPSAENLAGKVKKEYWGFRTPEYLKWGKFVDQLERSEIQL